MMTRTAALPFGLSVMFTYTGTGLRREWSPEMPAATIRTNRARAKLIAAYTAARDDFLKDIATLRNSAMIVADVEGGSITRVNAIEPGVRQ